MTTPSLVRRIVLLAPHAEQTLQPDPRPLAPRLAVLDGARIVLVDNGFAASRVLHEAMRRELRDQAISWSIESKRYWEPLAPDRITALAADADAVVGGLGQTPPSTMWGIQDAMALERLGTPTVSLATSLYEDLIDAAARSGGMRDLKRVIVAHPLEGQPDARVREIAVHVVSHVVAALTSAASPSVVHVSPHSGG